MDKIGNVNLKISLDENFHYQGKILTRDRP